LGFSQKEPAVKGIAQKAMQAHGKLCETFYNPEHHEQTCQAHEQKMQKKSAVLLKLNSRSATIA